MVERTLTLNDLFGVWRRRWLPMLVAMLVVLVGSVAVALYLPPVYRSTATVSVERTEFPAGLVGTSIPGYAAEQIQSAAQRVMTLEKLWAIAQEFNLYPVERQQPDSQQIVVSKIRDSISLDTVGAEVINPKSGKEQMVTIAFTVSFDNAVPATAQAVATRLTELFVHENRKDRAERVEGVPLFLAAEARKLEDRISELEDRLAVFKRENANSLPTMKESNLRGLEIAEREYATARAEITALEERRDELVARMRQSTAGDSVLAQLRTELATALQRYSEIHPDVVRLRRMIEGLEAGDIKSADVAQPDPGQAGNLALMRSQLESLNARLKSENTQLDALKTKVSEYRGRLEKSPEVEREYLAVSRDYDAALNRYRELKNKEMDARLAAALEQTDKGGERFSIIDPAMVPSIPYKPERGLIIALGFVLSLAAAVGMAVLLELFDRTVHGKRGLSAAINAPPIGVIPNIA